MALKFMLKSEDAVPVEQPSVYLDLGVEGAAEKAKLDNFWCHFRFTDFPVGPRGLVGYGG